jgi:RNAse (barnase) inhibitor barstar
MHDPCFHLSSEAFSATEAGSGADGKSHALIHFDGTRMATKELMLDEFASVLRLPDWFGHNWDALIDVLRDCWFDTPELPVLVFHNADAIGSRGAKSWVMLMSIRRSVVTEVRKVRGAPIYVRMMGDDPLALSTKIVRSLEHDKFGERYTIPAQEDVRVSE